MKSRYPLIRFELFKTHKDAVEAYKESEKIRRNAIWNRANLSIDDGYVKIMFREYTDSTLRGWFIDKIVFHYIPDIYEISSARSHINPNTTVENPIQLPSEEMK